MPKIFSSQAEMEAYAFAPPEAPKLRASPQSIPVQASVPGQDLLLNIDKELDAATKAPDAMTAAKALSNVRGSIAAEQARFFQDAQGKAYAEFQVPLLEQALAQNIQMDRSTPSYVQKFGMADSDETAAVRRSLMTAKSAADATINERLNGNPVYASLMAKAKTSEQLIQESVMRGLRLDDTLNQKATLKMMAFSPVQKLLFSKATGVDQNDTKTQFAVLSRIEGTPGEEAQMAELMQGGEKAIPGLALKGNVFAQKVLLDNEAAIFGGKEAAAAKISKLNDILQNNKVAAAAYTDLKNAGKLGTGPEVEKQAADLRTLLAAGDAAGKENKQAAALRRVEIAQLVAKHTAEKDFNSDIVALRTKSSMPVPVWLQQAADASPGAKISKTDAIRLAQTAPSFEERKARINELVEFYDGAARVQNKSLLFGVSPLAADQLKAEASLGEIFGKFFKRAGMPGLGEIIGEIPPMLNYEQRIGFPTGKTSPQQLFEYKGEMLTRAEYDRRRGEDYYKPIRGAQK